MFQNPYSSNFSIPNPAIPYDAEIPNGLQAGKLIRIQGRAPGNSQRFSFNLVTPQGFVAFHLNPRFDENTIVRNTNRGGWGKEERHGPMVFKRNEPFDLVIQPEQDRYKVTVNGQHIFDYNHRLPLNEVNRLKIDGQVEIQNITYVGGAPPRSTEAFNPAIPSAVHVPGGFRPGKLIQILGTVPPNAGRFEIDVQQGNQIQPNDINLHFNPRWNDPYSGQPVVVRTHRRSGGWGNEDRNHPQFPFNKGAPFEVLILCEPGEWKVAVNGQHFISYPHHVPFATADHVAFVGDVQIQAVKQFN